MQIYLTKKLADELKTNYSFTEQEEDPLFSWTANWTNVWDNRKTNDMLVLVNNATRFTVAIYQVKRKDLKNVDEMMKTAIANTLLYMNINPAVVKEYLRQAGEIKFTQNRNRQKAAWVSKAGLECAFEVGRRYDYIDKMFNDTVGIPANYRYFYNDPSTGEDITTSQAMTDALTKLTGMQIYKYRAFELLVSLDLEIYQAVRRLIVPAHLRFDDLHRVLQYVYFWKNYHLFDFIFFDGKSRTPVARLVSYEEDLEYDKEAIFMEGLTLAEYMPKHKHLLYTYDMGDNWQHEISLVRVIEDCDMDSPFLVEASGQAPPEDVGGVGGFISFLADFSDPDSIDYQEAREWAGYWKAELDDWQKRPRKIDY